MNAKIRVLVHAQVEIGVNVEKTGKTLEELRKMTAKQLMTHPPIRDAFDDQNFLLIDDFNFDYAEIVTVDE
jgi:hypothetical protein